MPSLITDEIRAAASEMYTGDAICQEKSKFLLTEMGLPNGLLPLKDMVECGYVKETGFVWLIQKKKSEHRFEKINRPVQYAAEVTAYIEPKKIRKLTGVKTKELFMWVSLSDITVDEPPTGKITFKTPTGLFRSFPVEAFEVEVAEKEKPAAKEVKGGADVEVIKDVKDDVEVKNVKEARDDVEVKEVNKVDGGANVEVKEGLIKL